jgi:hypothetical protein
MILMIFAAMAGGWHNRVAGIEKHPLLLIPDISPKKKGKPLMKNR